MDCVDSVHKDLSCAELARDARTPSSRYTTAFLIVKPRNTGEVLRETVARSPPHRRRKLSIGREHIVNEKIHDDEWWNVNQTSLTERSALIAIMITFL
jgi:hypothetical protein